jgi:uncharacterized protein YrrD
MHHYLGSMIGYRIQASDGELGKVNEFYFDDATWSVRYMVVETGTWLSNRKVLISSVALNKPDLQSHMFSVNLTCDQVCNSPDIDTEKPVCRQHEIKLHEYYKWRQYWDGGYGGTFGITPFSLLDNYMLKESVGPELHSDPHLRSTCQVTGYKTHASDGEIGHVEDFIIDDKNWTLQYFVVNIGNWLPGRKVLVSPKWIKSVNWIDASVHFDHSREAIRTSPEFDPAKIIHRESGMLNDI